MGYAASSICILASAGQCQIVCVHFAECTLFRYSARIVRGPLPLRLFIIPRHAFRLLSAWFKPSESMLMSQSAATNPERLTAKSFRVPLTALSRTGERLERKALAIKARLCRSTIALSATDLSFGDVNVGIPQSQSIQVKNLSDLATAVEVVPTTSIISVTPNTFDLPPRQSQAVAVTINPVRVNTDFQASVRVLNLRNRSNDQVLDTRSSNVDLTGEALHALFYAVRFGNVGVCPPILEPRMQCEESTRSTFRRARRQI